MSYFGAVQTFIDAFGSGVGASLHSASRFGRVSANAFKGTGSGRRLGPWQETNASINSLLTSEGEELRRRCRALVRKNHWARSAEDSFVANAIGTGIKPQSKHPDEAVRKLIHEEWLRWTDAADADELTDFYGLQALAMREVFQAGEVLVRLRSRLPVDQMRVPLQLQLIEGEHLPYTKNEPVGVGNRIRAGIEFNAIGRRVAYHLHPEHPGLTHLVLRQGGNMPVRVPAFDRAGFQKVLHQYLPLRAGQYRGQPFLAPVMVTLYELDQFVDAVLVRQKLSNMFVGWQRQTNPDEPGPMLGKSSPEDGVETPPAGVDFGDVQSGTIVGLDPGDTLEFNTPPGVGADFDKFVKVMLHAFASGIGVPYESFSWDLEGVNFSSIRAGMLEFRRRIEQLQFGVVVHQFCRPVWQRWINDAVLAGILPTPQTPRGWDELYSVNWRTPKWAWVDPLKDVQAVEKSVRGGFNSRDGVIHDQGLDPETVDEEIAAGNKRADRLGLVLDSDPRKTARSGAVSGQSEDERRINESANPDAD